jgi:hypothetical protein
MSLSRYYALIARAAALREGGEGSLPSGFRIIRTETVDEANTGTLSSDAVDSLDADDVVSFLRRLVNSASGGGRTSAVRQRGLRQEVTLPEFAKPHKEPQAEGVQLIIGGEYGRVKSKIDTRAGSKNLAKYVLSRRSRLRPSPKEDVANVRILRMRYGHLLHSPQGLVPNTNGTMIVEEDANIYCAQFSAGAPISLMSLAAFLLT